MGRETHNDTDDEPTDDFSTRYRRELDFDKHALYGLDQSHGYVGKYSKINVTGSPKRLLEDRAIELANARHPHGIMLHTLIKKTRISTGKQLQARALHAELSNLLQTRRLTTRQRKSLHRIRDELVEWWKQTDKFGEVDYHGRMIDLELLKTPVDADDEQLVRAKKSASPDTRHYSIEQVELDDSPVPIEYPFDDGDDDEDDDSELGQVHGDDAEAMIEDMPDTDDDTETDGGRDDRDEWQPEPATLRDDEHVDDDSHAARNLAMLKQAVDDGDLPESVLDDRDDELEPDGGTETHIPDDDCVLITDGGRDVDTDDGELDELIEVLEDQIENDTDPLEALTGERVLVTMRTFTGPTGQHRRTGTILKVQRRDGLSGLEYVVDLDGSGHAYVDRSKLEFLDRDTDDAVETVDVGRVEALAEDLQRWEDEHRRRARNYDGRGSHEAADRMLAKASTLIRVRDELEERLLD